MTENDKNLVRLAAFEFEYEAILLRNALNDRGIPAWVTGGDGVNTFGAGLTSAGLVGVDINIRQIDLADAKIVLAEFKSGQDEETVIAEWKCGCGESVDAGFAVCWSCGADYDEAKQEE